MNDRAIISFHLATKKMAEQVREDTGCVTPNLTEKSLVTIYLHLHLHPLLLFLLLKPLLTGQCLCFHQRLLMVNPERLEEGSNEPVRVGVNSLSGMTS